MLIGLTKALGLIPSWWPGYCDSKKGECDLNQSKDDSFVKLVAKNNNGNNGDRHKIHEKFMIVLLSLQF